jgi:mannose-6-phosphate isomerase-like protein (cupin superfamily)
LISGGNTSEVNEPYLLPGLKRSTQSVRRILALIPNASLDVRQEGRLTPREALAHLADLEPLYRARLELAVSSPGSKVDLIDVDGRIVELGFAQSDPDREMIKWEEEREKTIEFLEGLADEDWSKKIIHPERGEASIYVLAYQVLAHDAYHLEQFSQSLMPEATEPFVSVEAPHLTAADKPEYKEYIQTRSMSVGIYELPAGSKDGQVPHLQDELYYVISGRGKFEYEGQEVQVGPGSSLFVAAEKDHRFFDIVEDLRVLVVFSTSSG